MSTHENDIWIEEFIEEFKELNGREPTQAEVQRGLETQISPRNAAQFLKDQAEFRAQELEEAKHRGEE